MERLGETSDYNADLTPKEGGKEERKEGRKGGSLVAWKHVKTEVQF